MLLLRDIYAAHYIRSHPHLKNSDIPKLSVVELTMLLRNAYLEAWLDAADTFICDDTPSEVYSKQAREWLLGEGPPD